MTRLRLLPPLLLLLCGCASTPPITTNDNLAYLYGKGAGLRLQARVYHASDTRTVVYFKLRTQDLLYKSSGGGGPFRARVLLSYESYASLNDKRLLDSASTWVKDQSDNPDEDKELIGSIDLKRNDQRNFVLRITARDQNREGEGTVLIDVEKDGSGSRQDFLPITDRGLPYFDDRFKPGMSVRVLCERHANAVLACAHWSPGGRLPMPVFSEAPAQHGEQRPDSTFTINVNTDGWFRLDAPRNGFYHLRTDTTQRGGWSMFSTGDGFPEVRTVAAMAAPLRYITSGAEWDRISKGTDQRKEVERFWKDAAGERERARHAIDAYYSRVENANRFFTGTVEGWRTDRGLVHIIFGPPNTIRRTAQGESWTYGAETDLSSLTFNFVMSDDPLNGDDLVLRRDPLYKTAWYRNVESWRNGRITQN